MPRKKPTTATTAIIQFPIPQAGPGDDTDPRWQRVEALYGEIAKLDPGWFTDRWGKHNFPLLLEQAFCHYIAPILIETWDMRERAQMAAICQRLQHNQDERARQERLDRLRAGTPHPLDSVFRDDSSADEELDDLVIRLQRRVEDLRRDAARQQQKAGAR